MYEFASDWVSKGHDVTVVSSIYSKSDLKASKFVEDQLIDGIKLKVINIRIDNKQSLYKRIYTFVVYAIVSSWYALTLRADVVIASSGPISVGIPGLIARFIRRRKLVFEVRDLWPQGAIELGIINNPLVIRLAYWFERTCYAASSLVVALSPGARDYIRKNHGHPNIISITNAADISLFSQKLPFDGRGIVKKRKYAIYSGNIGTVNNAYWLFHAAIELKARRREDIKILLVGDGQQRDELEVLRNNHSVSNFLLWPLVPKEQLVQLMQNALVSLVPLKDTPILNTSSPNKLFESLAAGVPVIQNTNGWIKTLLDDYCAGFTINANQPTELADLLILLDGDSQLVDSLGRNASRLALDKFDTRKLAQKFLESLEDMIQ